MKRRSSFGTVLVLVAVVVGSLLVTPATAKKPPKPTASPPAPWSDATTYVKSYASVVDGVKCDLTPEAVRATADGGSILLALSSRPSDAASDTCQGGSWLVKLDAAGRPQWQQVVGCLTPPAPGGFAYGVSLQQTADGGYVIAGGTRDCEGNPLCPYLTSRHCGLVQKLDGAGRLVWARVYSSSPAETSFWRIRQTSDGGFVVAGTFRDADSNVGGLILKLDGQGNVQWQMLLGPAGTTHAYLNDIRQTPDGGFVAVGQLAPPTACQYGHGCGQSVLVVRLDATGDVLWQRGFNSFDANGVPTASEHALATTTTPDGGYLVAGAWGNGTGPGSCCRGALLLKLDANGNSQWQKALSGGVHCFFNGLNTTCHAIGAVVYSVDRAADGGYVLAGSGNLRLSDGAPLVPWLAKIDANGNLLWQHFYFQSHGGTDRPLSQYFASSDVTAGGNVLAVGFTSNATDLRGELLAVRTDSAGLVGGCSQVRPATPLEALDPGLAEIAPGLPVRSTAAAQADLPSRTQATSLSGTAAQC